MSGVMDPFGRLRVNSQLTMSVGNLLPNKLNHYQDFRFAELWDLTV